MHLQNGNIRKFILLLASFLVSYALFDACTNKTAEKESDGSLSELAPSLDLAQLKEKGEITAITLYSSTSYFQYKMKPMGYDYDLIKAFALSEGLKLKIVVAENVTRLTEMLENGEGDVIAYPIPVTTQSKKELIFCGRDETSSQVLVQRISSKDTLLTDVTELIGKGVYVKHGTKYQERLDNLNLELGGGIEIHDISKDTVSTEDLIEMVSLGEIPYTVSDDKTAKLNKTYFRNIDISLEVSFPQRSSWAVRKNCPELAVAIDQWVNKKSTQKTYQAITKRYFEYSKNPPPLVNSLVVNGVISPYDSLFKKYANRIGWDWQLLAAIAYQESRFNPKVVSWAGAEGLMGIMPNTAKGLGVSPDELRDPDTAVKTAIECLRRFNQGFSKITNPEEKIKFTLGSYNAGIGHIYDARRLTEKYNKDPNVWNGNVEEYVRLKSDPEYYNDPVVQHGYLRGLETYNYVKEILERYHYYKKETEGKTKKKA